MPARPSHPAEMIVEARRLYVEGISLATIKARTGIPPGTLGHYLDGAPTKSGLTYPPIPRRRDRATATRRAVNKTSRPALIARLWTTAERQVAEIETRLSDAGGDAASLERDARTLAILAKTVRDLVSLDEAAKPKPETHDDGANEPPRDLDAFRRALAEKLVELGRLERDA